MVPERRPDFESKSLAEPPPEVNSKSEMTNNEMKLNAQQWKTNNYYQ